MNIKAKMRCDSVKPSSWGGTEKVAENVSFGAVYSSDPNDENKSFSDSTPSATITMTITNKSAFGAFIEGKEYYVDFTPSD